MGWRSARTVTPPLFLTRPDGTDRHEQKSATRVAQTPTRRAARHRPRRHVTDRDGIDGVGPVRSGPATIGADEFYINYAEPAVQPDTDGREVKGKGGIHAPAVAEAEAIKTGKSPRQIKAAKGTQTAKLLTLLVEFNENANDDFTDVMVPKTVFEDRSCVLGTVQNGPLHNNIANPASLPKLDNNSMWVPDFSPAHYNKMLYTSEGITERVRTDLTGPDGKPGISLAGRTMRNMYLEMSKGSYTVNGQASPWIKVPHSESWYAASRCFQDENGNWVAGRQQSMNGHPDNPQGAGRLATDAIDALAATDPNFPWADYDIEDQGDRDGDGNVFEPDGVIDHLVLVHAGKGKSAGGGAQGTYAVWAHSSSIVGGYTIPGTQLKVSNYIVQPEDAGVGVFAHEYGHDLGLPDLYDTSGNADSDVDFWDLMASGSHSGEIFQALPTHMGLWDKWILGWADPLQINPGATPKDVQLGQTSRTPVGTKDDTYPRFYIAENRSYFGYDDTLRTGGYNFGFNNTRPNFVERFAVQPGMLVWYVNYAYGDNNTSEHPGFGLNLPVDVRPGTIRVKGQGSITNRRNGYDSTFSLYAKPAQTFHLNGMAITVPELAPNPVFDDTRANRYWSADNSWNSVKVAGTGTRIEILKQGTNPTDDMVVKVTN
ncbi:immune inhibitor A domain-containing protein [Micromonospora thermarum]|uniref:immune inhibitor A domain-containing protein n=1 Tax=Micromonospora thermarum TaxID=2720024 RepID=UPI002815DFDA|nr:immune inhibitor A domain-containing protein [Micromonospora thermarum]